jgi:hypothetical protein
MLDGFLGNGTVIAAEDGVTDLRSIIFSQGYRMGYSKPPIEARFQKRRSGNPAGRPRKSKSLEQVIQQQLAEPVTFTENGREWSLSKSDVILMADREQVGRGLMSASKRCSSNMSGPSISCCVEDRSLRKHSSKGSVGPWSSLATERFQSSAQDAPLLPSPPRQSNDW